MKRFILFFLLTFCVNSFSQKQIPSIDLYDFNGEKVNTNDLLNNILFIKKFLKKNFKYKNTRVLYGGSVSPNNIKNLREINQIDGFLIGGASQNPNKFIDIIKKTFN